MAEEFDPSTEFGTVHWADEGESGGKHMERASRKRTRSKSLTPHEEERASTKFRSIVKETAGVSEEKLAESNPSIGSAHREKPRCRAQINKPSNYGL